MHQRRTGDRFEADEHVHRHVGGEPGRADAFGEAEPTEVLHRTGVAALHFGQSPYLRAAIDELACDPLRRELEGQCQPDWAASDDEDR